MVHFNTAHRRFGKLALVSALCLSVSSMASAQSDAELGRYTDILNKKLELTVKVAKMQEEVRFQENQIANLEEEVATVGGTVEAMPGLVASMVNSYAAEFEKDAPFNASERFERLSKLQQQLEDGSSTTASMFRRALGMYEAEVNYGLTVEQYPGNHPLEARSGWRLQACTESLISPECNLTADMKEAIREKTGENWNELDPTTERNKKYLADLVKQFDAEKKLFDGNYLRVGRLALIYADINGAEVLRYDLNSKRAGGEGQVAEWITESGAEQINLYRAVKMAKGEAAVDVMKIPVIVD